MKEVGSRGKNASGLVDHTGALSTSPHDNSGRRTPLNTCATLLYERPATHAASVTSLVTSQVLRQRNITSLNITLATTWIPLMCPKRSTLGCVKGVF